MTAREKLLNKVLRGTSDRDIPFDALCSLLESLGFELRTPGMSS
jgi:hypothetical protein